MDSLQKRERRSCNGGRAFNRSSHNDGERCRACHDNLNREDTMATKAYILIKVKAGRTKDALQALKRIAGVEQLIAEIRAGEKEP